ncbi:MAG: hypothetical protein IPM79_36440 [Polyangiaceae bacterium]|nr:hypothetical protein [Polyangiaceae bacterium]
MDRFHPTWHAEVASPRPLAIAVEPIRGRPEATVVLKLTFAPDERGVAALTPDQEPIFPTPIPGAFGGIANPSDAGGPRTTCDVLLVGSVSALGGPASLNLNERGWRAAHARGLGPLERLTDRGWAPFPQRIPFPRLPLSVSLTSPALSAGCSLAGPEPYVAVAWEPQWQPVALQLSIDRVSFDVDRGRVTLTYRGPFALGTGRFLVLADPAPTPAFFEQARTWPRAPCADLAELASRGAGPLPVPVAAALPPASARAVAPLGAAPAGAAPASAPPAFGLPFGPPASGRNPARGPLQTVIEDEATGEAALPFARQGAPLPAVSMGPRERAETAPMSRVVVPGALPFRSLEGARSLVTPSAQPVVDQAQPVVDQAQPVVDQAQPVAFQGQTVAFPAQLLVPQAQPVAFHAQPLVPHAQPVAFNAQPIAAPAAFHAQPIAAPAAPPPAMPSSPRAPMAQPSYLREQAARQAAASVSAAPMTAAPAPVGQREAESGARAETRIDGLTLEQIAIIRVGLLRKPEQRRALFKEHGLTELKWRLVERRLAEHLRKLEAQPADLVREVRALARHRADEA